MGFSRYCSFDHARAVAMIRPCGVAHGKSNQRSRRTVHAPGAFADELVLLGFRMKRVPQIEIGSNAWGWVVPPLHRERLTDDEFPWRFAPPPGPVDSHRRAGILMMSDETIGSVVTPRIPR